MMMAFNVSVRLNADGDD